MAIKKIKLPNNSEEVIQDSRLPNVDSTDDGKYLGVSSGIWGKISKPSYNLDEVLDGTTRKLSDYLPLSGGTMTGDLALPNDNGIYGTDTNSTTRRVMLISASNHLTIGDGLVGVGNTLIYGTKIRISPNNNSNSNSIYFQQDSDPTNMGPSMVFYGPTTNKGGGSIQFYGSYRSALRNGFKIASENGESADRLNLVFYRSNVDTSPYAPNWIKLMVWTYNGKVNINGPATTNGVLNVNGDVDVIGNITASGTITPGSDSRIKDNQQDILKEDAFFIIERLKPKTWIWNEKSNENLKGKSAAGLVAQDVKEILPDAVTIADRGNIKDFHSLNYNTIQGYELAAIKGLIEEVKALKAEITELKKQIK